MASATKEKQLGLAVQGAGGRVGQRILTLAPSMGWRVAAAWGRGALDATQQGPQTDSADCAVPSPEGIDVVVDFSAPEATRAALRWCRHSGIPIVVGTTGLEEIDHSLIDDVSRDVAVLQAANTSLGVNLLLALVRQAAAMLSQEQVRFDAEIVETHHRHKRDAPSGTALALLDAVRTGRDWTPKDSEPDVGRAVNGRSGLAERTPGEIGMHAIRAGGVAGDHQVHFASELEVVTLGHRALDRDVFAQGALTAARWLTHQPAGRYEMADVLSGVAGPEGE